MSVLLPFQNRSFPTKNAFSWPVLILVLLIHAALFACLLTGNTTHLSFNTPPITGVLISPASSAKNGAKTDSRQNPGLHAPKNPARSNGSVPSNTLDNKKDSRANEKTPLSNGKNTPSSDSESAHKASGPSGVKSGDSSSGAFFSPHIDAGHASNPKPPYPLASRRMGEEGTVILSVYILSSGMVDKIRIKKSSGYPRLDNAALEAVKKWRYIPAKNGDTPVAIWHTQAIRFSLKD